MQAGPGSQPAWHIELLTRNVAQHVPDSRTLNSKVAGSWPVD